jgi:type VI secretion system protein ImpC
MIATDFDALLSRPVTAAENVDDGWIAALEALAVPALRAAAALVQQGVLPGGCMAGGFNTGSIWTGNVGAGVGRHGDARVTLEGLCAEIDLALSRQINLILHHAQFQAMEATWRGLYFLVRAADTGSQLKIKLFNIGKRELARTLRKFRGTAWDQSPIFRRIYEEEYGQFGGEPYGILIGDYYFDSTAADVHLLADIAKIAAAAHAPFLAGAAPALLQMDSWAELANPRDLTRIFQTPEYVAWRALRDQEDSRYLGLCMPRCLGRLPYGARTDPQDAFAFEEDAEGTNADTYVWTNAAYAFGANVARAFSLYGWCTRIRGIDSGGIVEGLPSPNFPTADGAVDLRGVTEIALSERREAELARNGLIPLVQRKNEPKAAFVSAHSVQQPQTYEDPAASANAVLSSRLPYLFACCRFAHYLKCMVRDKIGSTMSRAQLENWLEDWLLGYVDGSPTSSSDEWKAAHPLQEARVAVDPVEESPGQYAARFFLRPHYQLEGITVAMRLVSRLPAG